MILSNKLSHWGSNFAWEQSTLNIQLGHDELEDCDWIIRADADHVLDTNMAHHLRTELETRCSQNLNIAFPVLFYWNGKYHRRPTPRNWIINNRLARLKGLRVGWGQDQETGLLSDAPLLITEERIFKDPETNVMKPYLIGTTLVPDFTSTAEVYRYGHFFFTREQAIAKCQVWSLAVADFTGRRSKGKLELMLDADVVGIVGYSAKAAIIDRLRPPPIRRLIEEYYQPSMLGGARYLPGIDLIVTILRWLVRLQHQIRKVFGRV
jgi:hypothetical protein